MSGNKAIELGDTDQMREAFRADPVAKLVQNAVTTTPVTTIALNRDVVAAMDPLVSDQLDGWPVTAQGKSGRCWLFAGLNLLKAGVVSSLNLDSFEFSQNYLHFWDKLEKANWFFTSMIELADQSLDDRTVAQLLRDPIGDGGQWDMFVALVEKYGLVPKYAMPETESSANTKAMNTTLETLLRRGARDVRAAGDAAESVRHTLMTEVYRVLAIHLGTPPDRFVWQFRDKDKQFTRVGEVTPRDFARDVLKVDLSHVVCAVNDPRHPYGAAMTVDHLGNVVGGRPIRYLNVPADLLEAMVVKGITGGHPVWFGCDVAPQFDRKLGLWDQRLLDFEALYGVDLTMTKAERMELGAEAMNHAMLFTGVDLVDGRVRRLRVENSWGGEVGDKGFMTMNASWFAEHVFEVAVPLADLPEELQRAAGADPLVLPLWDPMGTLA